MVKKKGKVCVGCDDYIMKEKADGPKKACKHGSCLGHTNTRQGQENRKAEQFCLNQIFGVNIMAGVTRKSIKDIIAKVAGPEPDPVVYAFSRTAGAKVTDGRFTEPANQEGHGVYGQDDGHDN